MENQLLRVFAGKRQRPAFTAAMIEGWSLPSWFMKQNDLLNSGYIFGKYQFANVCFRNWTAFSDAKGQPALLIDREGTISFPNLGVSVEIWVNDGWSFITPGKFLQTKQRVDPEFPCVETKGFFKRGSYQSRLFPILGLPNNWLGLELNLEAAGELAFNDLLIALVVRPYDHNGLTAIRGLEYKNKRLIVNYLELLQFETEPKIIFCSHAGLGDVTEYLKLEENKLAATSADGSCTGLIGYSVRPADRTIIKLVIKPDTVKFFPNQRREFSQKWFWESKQRWFNSCALQHHLLKTGSKIDRLYQINLNYLIMFNGRSSDLVDVDNILVLNRLAFHALSRAQLLKALKKVRWDGSLSGSGLTPGKLIYAIYDYYQFAHDLNFIKDNWQTLKRMGYWLLQNQTIFMGEAFSGPTGDPAWICASLKSLGKLAEANGDFEKAQFFHQQSYELWSRILSFLSRRLKADNLYGYRQKLPVKEVIDGLAISYPLCLYQRKERFIQEWLERIMEGSVYHGGVIAPLEFQGIDLELTSRLGVILLREEREYDQVFKLLFKTVSSTGNWPDRVHPTSGCGIGATGHSRQVGRQFLLMLRNMMAMEEGDSLYLLPGIITSKFWADLNIELNNLPTIFGEIALKCQNIGKIVQIEFKASFRKKPRQIGLILNPNDQLLYTDSTVTRDGDYVYLNPDFRIVRFRRDLT